MKILHLSTSDLDGGASRAAYRLHEGLKKIALDSQMLVRAKDSIDSNVIADKSFFTKLGPPTNSFPLRFYPQRQKTRFSAQWFRDTICRRVKELDPDVIVLHWICNGFIQIETLAKFEKPIIWTLHDMWPLTGGCHYNGDCKRFQESCGNCPQLKSSRSWDLSRWVWQRKAKAWKGLNLTIVSPSKWLADQALSSSLFSNLRIEVIPYGLNLQKYQPIPQQIARQILQLSLDKKLILFGASPGTTGDPRKGFQFLESALQLLRKSCQKDEIELVIFGAGDSQNSRELAFKARYLGQFNDDISLSLIYAAADVFVAPSVQDNLPNTIIEALACGTPCVAFNIGGMPDMIDHLQNGYLAKPFKTEDLAKGIVWVLSDKDRLSQLRHQARSKVEREFFLELQASRYLSLFEQLTNKKQSLTDITEKTTIYDSV